MVEVIPADITADSLTGPLGAGEAGGLPLFCAHTWKQPALQEEVGNETGKGLDFK